MSVSNFRPRDKQYNVGDYVILKNREGYIRYIGKREFHHGCWYGIALTRGQGPNDGSEHGKRYFNCKQRHGIFVRLYAIKQRLDPSEMPHNLHKKIPKVNGVLPLLPQSKTLSESRSNQSLSSDSSLSNTPSPNPHKFNDHNIKLDTHRSLSNKHRNHTKKSVWHKPSHRPQRPQRPQRPKSARSSTSKSYDKYAKKKKVSKSPKFVLTSPRTPRQSPRGLKRSLTPRIQHENSYSKYSSNSGIIDIEEPESSVTSDTSMESDSDSKMNARMKLSLDRDRHYSNTPRKEKEVFSFDENQLHVMNMSRSSSVNTPSGKQMAKNKKSRRKVKKQKKKKKKHGKKKIKKTEKIELHDRTVSDIDGMKLFNYSKENKSSKVKGYNNYRRSNATHKSGSTPIHRPKLKQTNSIGRIKKYNKRESFHRRKSRTVDFDMSGHTQRELRELRDIMEQNKSEFDDSSSEDDNKVPVVKSPSKGKYTFRLHIKNNKVKNMNAGGDNEMKKEYNLILPNKIDAIPLTLKKSYSLNKIKNGPNLSLAVNDVSEENNMYGNGNKRKRTSTMSSSSNVAHQYVIVDDNGNTPHSGGSNLHSQVESNKMGLLNKNNKGNNKWELDLLPDTPDDMDSDALDNVYDNTDDILFISQNSMKNIHEIKEDEMNENGKGRVLGIDESVIEYHVPSRHKNKRKNKNIKINICINNDINTKKKKENGLNNNKKERHIYRHNKVHSTHSLATDLHGNHMIHSPVHSPKHHVNPSISSSQTLMKMNKKAKKKKVKSKHKHSHRHKSKRHKSKKNCSCHKHKDVYYKHKKDKKSKKDGYKKDRTSKQIKFRPKLTKKSVTPKNAMPPPPISPRNGYNVQRYDWTGLI